MPVECDVLVVGAGPAGSCAAAAAAQNGAKTILVDQKREIGVPVQCAESISKYLLPLLPFKIPRGLFIWETGGIYFWTADITIERTGILWSAYSIDRREFDKWLATRAVGFGATLLTSAKLVELKIKDGVVTNAIINTEEGRKEIKAKLVVGADGVDSAVLYNLGVAVEREGNVGEILSYELTNIELNRPHFDQLFIGEFAPGTYGYIFPKSKTSANVGIGTLFPKTDLNKKYEEFLDIPIVKKQLHNGTIAAEKSGRVPFRRIADKWSYGNVLLVGDAAAQNIKPFVEGYLPGIICGNIAGNVAARHISNNLPLDEYEKRSYNKLGTLFNTSEKIANIMYNLSSLPSKKQELLRLGISANLFPLEKIVELKNEDYPGLKQRFEKWNRKIKLNRLFEYLSYLNLVSKKMLSFYG